MQIDGAIGIARRPEIVEATLNDPAVLMAILPSCTGVTCVRPGLFQAAITRKLGLLSISVQPEIEIVTLDGNQRRLSLRAGSRIAGSVAADLVLTFAAGPGGTQLSWNGFLTTSGMAARLLSERGDQIGERVKALFGSLKGHAELRA